MYIFKDCAYFSLEFTKFWIAQFGNKDFKQSIEIEHQIFFLKWYIQVFG